MANLREKIEGSLKSLFQQNADKEMIDRGNLIEFATTAADRHEMVKQVCDGLTNVAKQLRVTLEGDNVLRATPWYQAYVSYTKLIGVLPNRMEQDRMFTSLRFAHATFHTMLNRFDRKQFEKLFPNPTISLRNMDTTQLMFLGVLQCSEVMCNCSVDLIGELVGTSVGQVSDAKYRYSRFMNLLPLYASLIDIGVESKGDLEISKLIDQLIRSNQNMLLLTDDNVPNTTFLNPGAMGRAASTFMAQGFHVPNPFRLIGELWALYRDSRVRKMETEREWLLRKIDLLRLKLQEADPNSREYKQIEKAIATYTTILDNYERKISRYREGKK